MRKTVKNSRMSNIALNLFCGAVCVVVLGVVFMFSTEYCKTKAIETINEVLDFAKSVSRKYDNYEISNKTKSLLTLQEKAKIMSDYVAQNVLVNSDLLPKYAEDVNISGVFVTDENISLVGQSNQTAFNIFKNIIQRDNIKSIVTNPKKSYMERIEHDGKTYEYAVVSRNDRQGLIVCYEDVSETLPGKDELSFGNLLSGYVFKLNGTVVITDGVSVLNSNEPELDGLLISECPIVDSTTGEWKDGDLVRLKEDGSYWFGNRTTYKSYYLYAFFPEREVFAARTTTMALTASLLLMFCMALIFVKFKATRQNMEHIEQQYYTISAVSSIYVTNLLIKIDSNRWEPIKATDELLNILKNESKADKMLERFVNCRVAAEYRSDYSEFVDISTLSDRLKGKEFIEYTFEGMNGNWYVTLITPMMWDSKNNVTAAVFATRNITEDKRRELKYQDKLKAAMIEAQRANVAKTDFLRRMSHDIRTPINGIEGMVAVSRHYADDLQKQEECRQKIMTAAGFLLELVNDVLDMNKLESGDITLENKPFDIKKLFDESILLVETQAVESGITIYKSDNIVQNRQLFGSPFHLKRILQNIMSNAVKYNRENGTITVSCTEKDDGDRAIIEFVCSDTGIGMSREFQEHMFEPFAQENNVAKTKYAGSGLGLPIAKELIEKMNGKISFESEKNKGTTFYVEIPFEICHDEQRQDLAPINGDHSIKNVSVLLVEDNELNMEIARFLLESEGAVVTSAENGKQAVELFEKSSPGEYDIIIMDVMMPIMNGIEATKVIRSLERADAKTVPIIAMSANAFGDDINESLKAGMNEHLAKPLNRERIIETILKYLNR